MALDSKEIVRQIEEVVTRYSQRLPWIRSLGGFNTSEAEVIEGVSLSSHTINRFSSVGDSFSLQAESVMNKWGLARPGEALLRLIPILEAMKEAHAKGYTLTIQELIHADLFSDFLAQAEYLHGEGFKDSSAVLTGGVLEDHLRKICSKHSISTTSVGPKGKTQFLMIDAMNQQLYKYHVYGKPEHADVAAWGAIRNSAAHGRYNEYD